MRNVAKLLSCPLCASLVLALLTTGCGKKPDGTPYGVDPAKLPEGRQKAIGTTVYKQDLPKGAELNAATNGARAGQPTSAALPPQTAPAR